MMFGQLLNQAIPTGFSFFSKKATLDDCFDPFDLGAYNICFYLAQRLVRSSSEALLLWLKLAGMLGDLGSGKVTLGIPR